MVASFRLQLQTDSIRFGCVMTSRMAHRNRRNSAQSHEQTERSAASSPNDEIAAHTRPRGPMMHARHPICALRRIRADPLSPDCLTAIRLTAANRAANNRDAMTPAATAAQRQPWAFSCTRTTAIDSAAAQCATTSSPAGHFRSLMSTPLHSIAERNQRWIPHSESNAGYSSSIPGVTSARDFGLRSPARCSPSGLDRM